MCHLSRFLQIQGHIVGQKPFLDFFLFYIPHMRTVRNGRHAYLVPVNPAPLTGVRQYPRLACVREVLALSLIPLIPPEVRCRG